MNEPRWFQVTFLARRVYDKQERIVSFTSAHNDEVLKTLLQFQNPGWIVKIKPISYEDVLKKTKCPKSNNKFRVDV